MNFIKTFLFVFCVLMSVFADDTLNIAIAPENDVHVAFYPVKYDATALFNSAGWAIGFINTKGDKKFDYNGSHMQVDLKSIPETVEIISAKLCLYVSKVVMDSNHDNKIATLSHYFSTGFTGDCLSDVQYAVDPPPVIEHVFDFNSGTQIG